MLEFPDKKYSIIYADPPWQFDDRMGKKGVESKYPTLSMDELKELPVEKIANDDCVLFLWCVFPMLQEGLDLIKAWGFTYKTIGFNWVKRNQTSGYFMGMGNWTRSNSEICLIGIRGKPKRIDAGISQIIDTPLAKHSKKPDIVRKRIIKLCGDLPRIELFARTRIHGWDVWGNDEQLKQNPLEAFA